MFLPDSNQVDFDAHVLMDKGKRLPDSQVGGPQGGPGDQVHNAHHITPPVLAHQLLAAVPGGHRVAAQPPREHNEGGGGGKGQGAAPLHRGPVQGEVNLADEGGEAADGGLGEGEDGGRGAGHHGEEGGLGEEGHHGRRLGPTGVEVGLALSKNGIGYSQWSVGTMNIQ